MQIPRHILRLAFLFVFQTLASSGVVVYVNVNNASPAAPFNSWATAATNIQDAVNVANPSDQILVTNGVYAFGSVVAPDGSTNRVVVAKPLNIASVNGSAGTVIDGGKIMRCIYLTNGAVLNGFTMTNGAATNGISVNGGGVFCTSTNVQLFNCQISGNWGKFGGGVYSGTLSNCVISTNTVVYSGNGGGAHSSTLLNCTITGNSTTVNFGTGAGAMSSYLVNCTVNNNTCTGTGATVGGGIASSYATNCTISGNRVIGAGSAGGGAHSSTLINCTLSGNRSDFNAGGANNCNLTNCTLVSNQATTGGGGGVCGGTMVNCILRNNTAAGSGGGVYSTTTAINCTIVGNHAGTGGGGVSCYFYNCIVYYNTASTGPNNYANTFSYCCTPDTGGLGNTTNAPIFVNQAGGDFHLQAGSGGIDAGTNGYVNFITDFDGNLRIANGTVDAGAFEYQQANPPVVNIQCDYTNVVIGITANFKGIISRGKIVSWDFGDGTTVSNLLFVSHAWATPGDYPVTLTTFDDSNPGGVSGVYVIHVIPPPISYVDQGSTNPVAPYSSWATAATNIQDAVDAVIFGAHIMVTNGTYQTGGRVKYGALTNRIVVNKPVLIQSVNGSAVTAIQGNPVLGDSAIRCAYLTNGATLSGFTLLYGATRAGGDSYKEQSGGAVWCESTNSLVANCLIISNAATSLGGGIYGGASSNCSFIGNAATGSGGGAYSNILVNCLLSNNTAVIGYGPISGGGASRCTLIGCLLISNITDTPNFHPAAGGGAVNSILTNCVLIGNTAKEGGGADTSTLKNCSLFNNSASDSGGGANVSTLTSSLVISNYGGMGGGIYQSTATNCVIQQNSSGYQGGGATAGFLYNCLLTGNSSPGSVGGGAAADPSGVGTTLVNCTVVGNAAFYRGGGVDSCTALNSIIVSNTVTNTPDSQDWFGGVLSYCCTPLPPDGGTNNIAAAPLFVNQLGGNFQLQTNSSCINAGTNTFVAAGPDLNGNPRIIAGTVDMGAYECQAPALLAYFSWIQGFGLPTTAAMASTDSDGDGVNNYSEWRAGTSPTNSTSVFRIMGFTNSPTSATVTWQSVAGRNYWIERATNLGPVPSFQVIATNIPGVGGPKTYIDNTANSVVPNYYRIGVQ